MNASARLTTLTRIGFAARGLLYIVIALLVIRTGRAEDPSGALAYLGEGGGQLLLGIMAAGLLGYGIWRLTDAAFDIERHGTARDGVIERIGAAASGVVHLFLAWQAVRLMRGIASATDGTQEGTQAALALPGGMVIVMLGGGVLALVGIVQLVKAAKASFLRHLEPAVADQPWAMWSGRIGYAARGMVFIISSFFLLKAGFQERADQAGGMDEALSWLANPFDLIIAVGLLGFGIFGLIEARYRVLHDVSVDGIAQRVTSNA